MEQKRSTPGDREQASRRETPLPPHELRNGGEVSDPGESGSGRGEGPPPQREEDENGGGRAPGR